MITKKIKVPIDIVIKIDLLHANDFTLELHYYEYAGLLAGPKHPTV